MHDEFVERSDVSAIGVARSRSSRVLRLVAVLMFLSVPLAAQPPAQPTSAGGLSEGWAALARGDGAKAAALAGRAMQEMPRSIAPVSLAVEVELVQGRPMSALDIYERWLGSRKVDAPYVLRQIATAHLHSTARRRDAGAARTEAFKGLVADGDPVATATLQAVASTEGAGETTLMASLGDERAVRALATQLETQPNKATVISALAESGSQLAVEPLLGVLKTGKDDDRAAAAEALARLGAEGAVEYIKPLLSHASFPVRLTAASALYRLGDVSGAGLLEELLASDHGAVRLSAAEALSVRPGGGWLDVARVLTSDPDQSVQLGAARLIAPYERELAESVLIRLSGSDNLAVREEAGRVLADRVASDFASLRRLLRSPDSGTSVRAASRILELTR